MTSPPVANQFAEGDLLPISALQHLLFCERQCALIHVEGLWAENRLTVEGRHLHAKARRPATPCSRYPWSSCDGGE